MFRAAAPLIRSSCEIPTYPVLVSVSRNYPGHMGRLPTCFPGTWAGYLRVTHPFATDFRKSKLSLRSVRLACIRHAASVHPEPGSNSPFDLALSDVLWHRFLFYRNWRFLFLSGLFLFSFQRSRSALSRAVLSYITKSTATRQHLFLLFLSFFSPFCSTYLCNRFHWRLMIGNWYICRYFTYISLPLWI